MRDGFRALWVAILALGPIAVGWLFGWNYFMLIGWLVVTYASLHLIIYGLWEIRRACASASWPTTIGIVTRSAVKEEFTGDGWSYTPEVEVEYVVGDRTYTCKRIRIGMEDYSGGKRFAAALVARYPVGKKAPVAYHPVTNEMAALEPGVYRQAFLKVAFGSIAMGILITLFFVWRRHGPGA
jgi:hypothetical protein